MFGEGGVGAMGVVGGGEGIGVFEDVTCWACGKIGSASSSMLFGRV